MTIDALNIYNAQRLEQLENGNFSETAVIDGSVEVKGIFDEHYYAGSNEQGNVPPHMRRKRFLVNSKPVFTPKVSTILISGNIYKIDKYDEDEYGVPRLWLR